MPPPSPRAPAIERPKRVTAAIITAPGAAPRQTAQRLAPRVAPRVAHQVAHQVAKATPVRHPRILARAVGPRYGAIVPEPPDRYPGMPVREPTQLAMGPPPYGMPPPYWPGRYPPY
jgi:hypothetical protein